MCIPSLILWAGLFLGGGGGGAGGLVRLSMRAASRDSAREAQSANYGS